MAGVFSQWVRGEFCFKWGKNWYTNIENRCLVIRIEKFQGAYGITPGSLGTRLMTTKLPPDSITGRKELLIPWHIGLRLSQELDGG